jgi:hypothetical protein
MIKPHNVLLKCAKRTHFQSKDLIDKLTLSISPHLDLATREAEGEPKQGGLQGTSPPLF